MGTDDNDEYVIRGVILDNPTPFTIGEMMETKASGGVYESLIFRGGESGGQEAFCLHSIDTLGLEEIGTSSIYQGGDVADLSDPLSVKFFFNYMEFLEQELEDMLEIIHEDGDGWTSVGKYQIPFACPLLLQKNKVHHIIQYPIQEVFVRYIVK